MSLYCGACVVLFQIFDRGGVRVRACVCVCVCVC
jgi:hypothetical protein